MTSSSPSVLSTFLAAAERVEVALCTEAVARHWEDSSALEGYTVAGLTGHLARGVLTVEKYLNAPAADNTKVTDAAGYMVAVLGVHDPVDSDFHRAVRARSREAASVGPESLARQVGEARQRLSTRLNEAVMDQRIEVLNGVVVTVEEYLRTRLVELVVHLDDLAVSVGDKSGPDLPQKAYEEVATVLAQLAVRRHGGLAVVRGLARRERHPDAIRAL
ncbi:maleylpyruvate isomerase N-terminal domain-containing protein [Arthrobacter sp. NPDC093139]|uniref:maleylpyruvate isomerase N-terminal domain-containing protein n=1 Tax=Arthrobacter sp. NPDC093139 TaxID=3363945 RepID=UPI00380BD90F